MSEASRCGSSRSLKQASVFGLAGLVSGDVTPEMSVGEVG